MKKAVKWFVVVFIVSLSIAVVPGFAEEMSSPYLFQLQSNSLWSSPVFFDMSDAALSGSALVESDESDQTVPQTMAQTGEAEEEEDEDYLDEEEDEDEIADPIEPVNRAFFWFNDKLYFYALKPAAQGYSFVIPEDFRIGIRNAFTNIKMPIRFVNCLLQLKIKAAGNELLRFLINTTAGVGGLADVSTNDLDIKMQDEDFGQTLGAWGLGPAFYINWPVLGPSSLRDTVGMGGDYFLNPINYADSQWTTLGLTAGEKFNAISLVIGDYEDLIEAAIDPYVSVRNAYHQYRKKKVED